VKTWNWLGQYAIAIVLSLLLGALLASLPLFQESAIADTHVRASHVVQFMGYGGALLLFWLGGRRATHQLQAKAERSAALSYIITPLITLIVLSAGYEVLLQPIGPFLGKTERNIYNWAFVVGTVSTALWLTLAWLRHSEPLLESLRALGQIGHRVSPQHLVACPQCNKSWTVEAIFCARCGARLAK